MHARTNGKISPPADAAELAAWLRGVDASDPMLNPMLISATGMVVDYLRRDLIARDWVLTYQDWPSIMGASDRSISPSSGIYVKHVELPYAGLIGTPTVIAYGDAVTDFSILDTVPSSICFDTIYSAGIDCESPALVISYRAGFGETSCDIPQQIKYGVLMLAAYLYSHSGACDTGSAVELSGAASILHSYRVGAGVAL